MSAVVYADTTDVQLAAALTRILDTKSAPTYLREAAARWLEDHKR